jgi:hypothetical protein
MGEERKVYKVLVGKPEGKRPLGRPRRMGSEWILGRLAWGVWIEEKKRKERTKETQLNSKLNSTPLQSKPNLT